VNVTRIREAVAANGGASAPNGSNDTHPVAPGCEGGNGITCEATCGYKYWTCASGWRSATLDVAPGTRCLNGALVPETDPRCANDGRLCPAGDTATKCWADAGNTAAVCTDYFYTCDGAGGATPPQRVAPGTKCHDGRLVTANDYVCAPPASDAASVEAPVVVATVPLLVAGEDSSSWSAAQAAALRAAVVEALASSPGGSGLGITADDVFVGAQATDVGAVTNTTARRVLRAQGRALSTLLLGSSLTTTSAVHEWDDPDEVGPGAVIVQVQVHVRAGVNASVVERTARALLTHATKAQVHGVNAITRAVFATGQNWGVQAALPAQGLAAVSTSVLTAPTTLYSNEAGGGDTNIGGGGGSSSGFRAATSSVAALSAVLAVAVALAGAAQ
jgi:hypothetical protein